VHPHAVGEIGELPRRRLPGLDRRAEQLEDVSLERELVRRVLDEQPRVLRALLTDERSPGPAVLGDELAQALRVADVDARARRRAPRSPGQSRVSRQAAGNNAAAR
jgi:hypothetical protein